jgi:hypothetical protein
MIKTALISLALMLSPSIVQFNSVTPAGGGCTVSSGNIFNESFDATGYDNGLSPVWEERDPDTGATIDPDDTTNPPLTNDCFDDKMLQVTTNATNNRGYIQTDFGTAGDEFYFRFYIALQTDSLPASGQSVYVFLVTNTTFVADATACTSNWAARDSVLINLASDGAGNFAFRLYTDGTQRSTNVNIGTSGDQRFRIELYRKLSATTTMEWKVHNMITDTELLHQTGLDVGDTVDMEGVCLGMTRSTASVPNGTIWFDNLGISDTGWLGE